MDGPHLSQLLDQAVARRPDHAAVLDEHGRTLLCCTAHGADRLATRLARWGVGRGDRVGLWLPKGLRPSRPSTESFAPVARMCPLIRPDRLSAPAASSLGRSQGGHRRRNLAPALQRGVGGSRPPAPPCSGCAGRTGGAAGHIVRIAGMPLPGDAAGEAHWARIVAEDDRRHWLHAAIPTTLRTSCSPRGRPVNPRA